MVTKYTRIGKRLINHTTGEIEDYDSFYLAFKRVRQLTGQVKNEGKPFCQPMNLWTSEFTVIDKCKS